MSALLSGCPTVDVGDPPITPAVCSPDFVTFRDDVWPNAVAVADPAKSCVESAGCHSRETGRSALRLITMPASPAEHRQNYDVVVRFLNCMTPNASPFLTKPLSGGDSHGGGDLWMPMETAPETVEQWISGG